MHRVRPKPLRTALLSLWIAATALGLPSRAAAQGGTWQVRNGDALSLVAQRFGVTVDQLRSWNELENDTIYVGQELVVDGRNSETDPSDGYRVVPGDTVSEIAARFGVEMDALQVWNPTLDVDRIQAGQRLRLEPERRRLDHTVRRGENLSRIAQRYHVKVSDLLSWNPRLARNRIPVGRKLTVYSAGPLSESVAVGHPSQGRLQHAVRLQPHAGYIVRDRDRAWATEETALWLREAADAVQRDHGNGTRIRVHDISLRRGGTMSGHVSHQNGRDADVSLYQRRCGTQPCPMRRLNPQDIDVARQWTFLESFLTGDRTEAIFVDYALQEALYRYARSRGATRQQLHRWFQYPRGRTYPLGVIRHYPRHRDHLHIRFRCHETDPECR